MYPSFAQRFVAQQKFTEDDQKIYNNHIIENFVESVNEMNQTVLIPSKLRDLDVAPNALNDDLLQYFRMINTVKKDLFEPHLNEESNNSVFTPKRKISKILIQRKEDNEASAPFRERKISSVVNMPVIPVFERKSSSGSGSSSRVSSCSDLVSLNGHDSENSGTAEDLKLKSSAQLTDQFTHHLRSMYNILDHFTKAAVYITEQYLDQIEA